MKIGIIDADLIGKQNHKFPNLACLKLSGYHKKQGNEVELIHFDDINPNSLFVKHFDKVYISKVFTDTKVPENILKLPFVEYGGTGFFYDKAPNLPYEIEHSFPDYNLYDNWIKEKIRKGKKPSYFKYYTDYSIGFTTRKCFRQCNFCVNRNYKKVELHSSVSEFLDTNRKKICLLDDNILGCGSHWERIIKELQATKKPFQYKQGLDIRLLSDKKAKLLSECKYDGEYIFAFDNIKDVNIIDEKLKIWDNYMQNKFPNKTFKYFHTKLYVLCAFDKNNEYGDDFWITDIENIFKRIKILIRNNAIPFVMRFEKYKQSKYYKLYMNITQWANQPRNFFGNSFKEYIYKIKSKQSIDFLKEHPTFEKYFNLKFGEVSS